MTTLDVTFTTTPISVGESERSASEACCDQQWHGDQGKTQ